MEPIFFASEAEFRKWLFKNHDKEPEVLVGFYKVHTGLPSMKWSQSVDEALCFGWIDGRGKSLDKDSFAIRFTPRRANSIWSAINIAKVKELQKQSLMQPAGLEIYQNRKESESRIYSHEHEAMDLSPEFEKTFKSSAKAWEFFQAQPPGYKKISIHHVMTAVQEKTKLSRLEKLISASEAGERV